MTDKTKGACLIITLSLINMRVMYGQMSLTYGPLVKMVSLMPDGKSVDFIYDFGNLNAYLAYID